MRLSQCQVVAAAPVRKLGDPVPALPTPRIQHGQRRVRTHAHLPQRALQGLPLAPVEVGVVVLSHPSGFGEREVFVTPGPEFPGMGGGFGLLKGTHLPKIFRTVATTRSVFASVSFAERGRLAVCRPMRMAWG